MSGGRHMSNRERWLRAVCDLRTDGKPVGLPNSDNQAGAPRQPGSFRTVMALLSMYADNDTGRNARPSLRLLQAMSHYKHDTVRAALDAARSARYITATGAWTPSKGGDPITVWALGYPTPAGGFVPWDHESVTPLGGTTDGDPAGRDHRVAVGDPAGRDHRTDGVGDPAGRNVGDSAGRNVGDSAGRDTTSSTSRPQGSEEDDEGAHAPSAGAPGAARLDGEQVNTVMASLLDVLHRRWKGQHQPVVSQRARDLVGYLLAAGWTPEQVQAAVATIGAKPRNPSALLEAHLRKQLDEHQPGDYGDGTPPAVPPDGNPGPGDLCRHGVDRTRTKAGKRKTACPRCDTFREACQDVIDNATRAGFVLQQDKHDDGQRLYTLRGRGRAVVTFRADRTGQWIDLSLEVSRPTEADVARMKDLFTVTPTVAHGWGYVFVDVTTDGEFLSALARLIDTATGWDATP